jgi:hypothetical protein
MCKAQKNSQTLEKINFFWGKTTSLSVINLSIRGAIKKISLKIIARFN